MSQITLFTVLLVLITMCSIQAETYTNPIIKGDWSDPALIRVGGDFYSLRSTFGWQPGLFVAHSKDLIHWEYEGYAYAHHPVLEPGNTTRGCWGSEMGYNPNNDTYLAYTPINSRIYAFAAKKPGGPYSEGVDLGLEGIDPGFFADDDGRLYLTTNRGKLVELAPDGLSVKAEICDIGAGKGMDFEGPDIFKHGKYYYCVYSGGGTRPHQESTVESLRASDLRGPWVSDPNNPVMQANFETGAPLQGPAHGTLVDTPNGEWFVSYHAFEISHYSLGRQMCLDPIEWTEDGWWRPINGKIPSLTATKPDLPEQKLQMATSDEFDSPKLGLQWFFHTKPDFSGESWSLTDRPGWLRIKTREGDISAKGSLPNVFLQRVTSKQFEFSTLLEFDPREDGETAGLHMYHDPGMNFWLASTVRDGARILEVGKYNDGEKSILWTTPNEIGTRVYFKIKVDANERASFFYSADGEAWNKLGGDIYFGDSWQDLRDGIGGDPDLGWVGIKKRNVWTAATIGVFACRGSAIESRHADFDWFRVRIRGEGQVERAK